MARVESRLGDPLFDGHVRREHRNLGEHLDGAGAAEALNGLDERQLHGELMVLSNELLCSTGQALDAPLQPSDVVIDIVDNGCSAGLHLADGVAAVLLADQARLQSGDPSHHDAKIEHDLSRRLPRHKGHTLSELSQYVRIDQVRLATRSEGLAEVRGNSGVENLDLSTWGSCKSHRDAEPGRVEDWRGARPVQISERP